MSESTTPKPTELKLHQKRHLLEVAFEDGQRFELSCELLRVYSPSAEVRGHGEGPGVLVTDKEDVNIKAIEPVGNYAVKLIFDDGHDTGLYSWNIFYDLGTKQEKYWSEYLERLKNAGISREME